MFPCLKPTDDLSVAFGVRLTVLSLRAVIWLLRTPWALSLAVATRLLLVFLVFCMSAGSHFHVSPDKSKQAFRGLSSASQLMVLSCTFLFLHFHSPHPPSLPGSCLQILRFLIPTFKDLSIVFCAPIPGWFRPCPPLPASPPPFHLFTHKLLFSHLPLGTGLGTGWRQSRMRQRSCPHGVPKSVKRLIHHSTWIDHYYNRWFPFVSLPPSWKLLEVMDDSVHCDATGTQWPYVNHWTMEWIN